MDRSLERADAQDPASGNLFEISADHGLEGGHRSQVAPALLLAGAALGAAAVLAVALSRGRR
jgi:hypothetical protein